MQTWAIVGCSFLAAALFLTCLVVTFRREEIAVYTVPVSESVQPNVFASFAEFDAKNLRAKPNILVFMADDMGYEDVASYGHGSLQVNYIDELARKGIRFNSVYAADSLCTPSRAGFLTGKLPVRAGMIGPPEGSPVPRTRIFGPTDSGGLSQEEVTIAETLKTVGYKTGMIGKWHIGLNAFNSTDGTYLPHNQGFDFVGLNIPLSNSPWCDEAKFWMKNGPARALCFLYNGSEIVQQPINFTTLTPHMIDDFERFLNHQNKDEPWFFYFSFAQVHAALFSWKNGFDKKSETGLYGGDLLEMADAMERAMAMVRARGMEGDTLVIFMSDHGPHLELCYQGGFTPFKGGKTTSFEGGYRIPFILSWPNVIQTPGGISRSVLSTLDLLPTLAGLTGAQLPDKIHLDGSDQRQYFFDAAQTTLTRTIFYYCNDILMAVRHGSHKFHYQIIPAPDLELNKLQCPNGEPLQFYMQGNPFACSLNTTLVQDPPLVYNLMKDPKELYPLDFETLPLRLREEFQSIIEKHRASLDGKVTKPQIGMLRPALQPCCNPPDCICDYTGPSVGTADIFHTHSNPVD